jgi:surface antigen
MTAMFIAFSAGGCAYQLETMFSKTDPEAEQTGSSGGARQADMSSTASPSEADLAYARAAAAEVIARGAKNSSIPWENPHTGAGGNITPLAAVNDAAASTCRDFLASYVRGQAQTWLQGEACRTQHGQWEVKSLKPFKQG